MPKTAFVLSGGASLGAVQVGMLCALAEAQIHPDVVIGTSAGALNAAFIAGHGHSVESVENLASLWRALRTSSLFKIDPLHLLGSVVGRSNAICPDAGLRRLVKANLTFGNLEDAPIECVVVATDYLTGEEVPLRTGSAMDAVLASCAIPGIFPPVWRDGRPLVDGGLSNNTALSQAVDTGADQIYVLPAGYSCALQRPPRTPIGALIHAFTVLTHQRLVADLAAYDSPANVTVLPPPCPISVSAANFSQSARLIEAAYRTAKDSFEHPLEGSAAAAGIASHRHH